MELRRDAAVAAPKSPADSCVVAMYTLCLPCTPMVSFCSTLNRSRPESTSLFVGVGGFVFGVFFAGGARSLTPSLEKVHLG